MASGSKTPDKAKPTSDRQTRLKAALKANMAKRKAQARARKSDGDDTTGAGKREG